MPSSSVHALAEDRAETVLRIASMTVDLESIALASTGSNIDDEHDPEGATVAFERAQLVAMLSRMRAHLGDVDAALARLNSQIQQLTSLLALERGKSADTQSNLDALSATLDASEKEKTRLQGIIAANNADASRTPTNRIA